MELSAACLRVFGETLDPGEITRLLGRTPSAAERKGDAVGPRENRVASQGGWRLEAADREPGDLDSQIEEILGSLTHDLAVWREITRDYSADLFCGVWIENDNEQVQISTTSRLKLDERGIRLSINVYDNAEANEDPASP